ncbi:MAG: ADYC domain-containing protein, partial [Kofleriaceae bacterium]
MKQFTLALTAALAAFAGCMTADDDAELGEANQDVISLNGTSLSGVTLTGNTTSGAALAGSSLLGVSSTGTSAAGAAITIGPTTGAPLVGAALVGSTWTGTATNSVQTRLRIDSALQGTAPNTDLWFYAVSYQTSAGWSPLCGLDASRQPIRAVSVAGYWASVAGDSARYTASATQFSLACRTKT